MAAKRRKSSQSKTTSCQKDLQLAKIAEHAERFDEMAEYMKKVVETKKQITIEERNLFSTAYKNAVGSRRASWRILRAIVRKEKASGNEVNATYAKEFCTNVEHEIQQLCNGVLTTLDEHLIGSTTEAEEKVFYIKMKADYLRYIAEFSDGDQKLETAENARKMYAEAQSVAESDLMVTHPIRLGLALNFSVFLFDVLQNKGEACNMARSAFEHAIGGLDKAEDGSYKETTVLMQMLRDNLSLWKPPDQIEV